MFFIRGPNRLAEGTRQAILRAIAAHPGLTEKELVDVTGLARGSVSHHLRRMAATADLRLVRRGRGAYYYLPTAMPPPFQHLMRLVRDDHCAAILRTLDSKPQAGIQALSSELSLSRKIVRRYLTELVDVGLVSRSDHYRPRFELKQETSGSLRQLLSPEGDGDREGFTRP